MLEAQILCEILCDFTNKTLEGGLSDEQICALLIAPDLAESDGSRTVAMRLLYAARCGGRFAGCLSGKLLAGGFASGTLAGSLLRSGHLR